MPSTVSSASLLVRLCSVTPAAGSRVAAVVSSAWIVAFHLIGAAPAVAQTRLATFDELRRELAPGDSISLVQTGGESVTGRLLRFGDNELDVRLVQRRSGEERRQLDVTIPLDAIRALERPRDSSRDGTLIGAGIGAGVIGAMFVYALAIDRNELDEWAPIYLGWGAAFTGIGALVGWAIDSAHSKPHIRFDAPSTEGTKVSVVPLLSRGPGMALSVSF